MENTQIIASFDGACEPFNPGGHMGIGWVIDGKGYSDYIPAAHGNTNNVAEYLALTRTVRNGAVVNPDGESRSKGHFWLICERPWSNRSARGKLLATADLPGIVTKTAGFQGTVCEPGSWRTVLRIIQDEKDPNATRAADAREAYRRAVHEMIKGLSPKDFEQLIDLILGRSGWVRICTLGGNTEGIDAEVENLAAAEIAFVQVKSSAGQAELNDYVQRFRSRRDRYARMIFAVHSPRGNLIAPTGLSSVQLWEGNHVADLVVRLGLGEWVENRLA